MDWQKTPPLSLPYYIFFLYYILSGCVFYFILFFWKEVVYFISSQPCLQKKKKKKYFISSRISQNFYTNAGPRIETTRTTRAISMVSFLNVFLQNTITMHAQRPTIKRVLRNLIQSFTLLNKMWDHQCHVLSYY